MMNSASTVKLQTVEAFTERTLGASIADLIQRRIASCLTSVPKCKQEKYILTYEVTT